MVHLYYNGVVVENKGNNMSGYLEVEEVEGRLKSIFERYKGVESELVPILQDVQEVCGYVPVDAITAIARFIKIPASKVYGVVTFYAQFYLEPQGKHKIKVCQGTACHVKGADEIMRVVTKKLGIGAGESTRDFEFSVEKVACFGSCALAPVMVVNDKVYGNVTPEQVVEILDGLSS